MPPRVLPDYVTRLLGYVVANSFRIGVGSSGNYSFEGYVHIWVVTEAWMQTRKSCSSVSLLLSLRPGRDEQMTDD